MPRRKKGVEKGTVIAERQKNHFQREVVIKSGYKQEKRSSVRRANSTGNTLFYLSKTGRRAENRDQIEENAEPYRNTEEGGGFTQSEEHPE